MTRRLISHPSTSRRAGRCTSSCAVARRSDRPGWASSTMSAASASSSSA